MPGLVGLSGDEGELREAKDGAMACCEPRREEVPAVVFRLSCCISALRQ